MYANSDWCKVKYASTISNEPVSTLLSNLKRFWHGIDWIWYGVFIQNLAISISMHDHKKVGFHQYKQNEQAHISPQL
jgi:hypothetical protein